LSMPEKTATRFSSRAAETGEMRKAAETAANSVTVSARKERSRVIFLIRCVSKICLCRDADRINA